MNAPVRRQLVEHGSLKSYGHTFLMARAMGKDSHFARLARVDGLTSQTARTRGMVLLTERLTELNSACFLLPDFAG